MIQHSSLNKSHRVHDLCFLHLVTCNIHGGDLATVDATIVTDFGACPRSAYFVYYYYYLQLALLRRRDPVTVPVTTPSRLFLLSLRVIFIITGHTCRNRAGMKQTKSPNYSTVTTLRSRKYARSFRRSSYHVMSHRRRSSLLPRDAHICCGQRLLLAMTSLGFTSRTTPS